MNGTGSPLALPLTVSHVADFYRRYPGETVTFFTRVELLEPLPAFTLRITVPAGLSLEPYQASDDSDGAHPLVTWDDGANHLTWNVEGGSEAPRRFEVQVQATVVHDGTDRTLESRAVVTSKGTGDELHRAQETVCVAVSSQGRYVGYLPALYQDDELMGRFLMLFESFWKPIEQQIESLPFHFDPRMAPPEFLPWLASWIHLVLDERWPEEKRRRLLLSAASLYRKRGTRVGLEEYLELYADRKPRIIEHRAHDFRLGPSARLGPGVALGTINVPHSFTVVLRLPPVSQSGSRKERARQELDRQRKIEAIIEAEKPAHTAYELRLEIDPGEGMRESR